MLKRAALPNLGPIARIIGQATNHIDAVPLLLLSQRFGQAWCRQQITGRCHCVGIIQNALVVQPGQIREHAQHMGPVIAIIPRHKRYAAAALRIIVEAANDRQHWQIGDHLQALDDLDNEAKLIGSRRHPERVVNDGLHLLQNFTVKYMAVDGLHDWYVRFHEADASPLFRTLFDNGLDRWPLRFHHCVLDENLQNLVYTVSPYKVAVEQRFAPQQPRCTHRHTQRGRILGIAQYRHQHHTDTFGQRRNR